MVAPASGATRCGRLSPVRVEELQGGEHPHLPGVVDVPTIVIPPETARHESPFEDGVARIGDPDGEGIICAPAHLDGPGCATGNELADDLAQLTEVEREINIMYEEQTGPSTGREDMDHLDLSRDEPASMLGRATAGHRETAPHKDVPAAPAFGRREQPRPASAALMLLHGKRQRALTVRNVDSSDHSGAPRCSIVREAARPPVR